MFARDIGRGEWSLERWVRTTLSRALNDLDLILQAKESLRRL